MGREINKIKKFIIALIKTILVIATPIVITALEWWVEILVGTLILAGLILAGLSLHIIFCNFYYGDYDSYNDEWFH